MPAKNFIITSLSIINLLLSIHDVKAHDSITHKIEKKTTEILNDKTNPDLYFERGYLYHLNDQFNKAIKDYLTSEKLGNKNKLLDYKKSETYLALNDLKNAFKWVNTYLTENPLNIKGHRLKAKILVKKNDYQGAKTVFTYVLDNSIKIEPKDYIDYANIILLINPENYTDAIIALDNGSKKSGYNLATLQLKKLEYLKKQNNVDKVIDQYNLMLKYSNRKEFLYFEKAKFLFDKNDTLNANSSLKLCELAINNLSSKYQNTDAIKKLKIKIQSLQNKL